MLISVAVPSYNYAGYIRDCLASIRKQDHADFEVLIADGGSTDGSIEIIREFCAVDPRFRLVSNADNGQADAVDKAFSQARGEVLCYLNADDLYLGSGVFSKIAATFGAYGGADIVSTGGYYVDAAGKYIKPVHLRYHPLDDIGWMKYRTAVLQPGIFWRRDVYRQIPFRKEMHFVFDAVFFYEVYLRYSWLDLPDVTAGYRLHGGNKSLTVRPERIAELAWFERYKFGDYSLRAAYLYIVYAVALAASRLPLAGRPLLRAIYLAVNSLAFITAYRLPGI